MTTLTFTVPGMTCGHCTAAVEGELRKIDGVSDVSVDLASKGVVVTVTRSTGRPSRPPSTRPGTRSCGDAVSSEPTGTNTTATNTTATNTTATNTTAADPAAYPAALGHVDLAVTGMTCAACAARIEKKLNRLDGVTATVNYATEKASVTFDPSIVQPAQLVETVESIGYGALLPVAPAPAGAAVDEDAPTPAELAAAARLADLRHRLIVSAALSAPVLAMSMIPALQFENWQWLALTLTAPVAVWGGWPFHRAAWANLRHRSTTMDTLVSLGVIAAFGWSVWALFLGDAGRPGMTMDMSLWPAATPVTPCLGWSTTRSTWRWRPRSSRSCSPAGTPRRGRAVVRGPRSGHC